MTTDLVLHDLVACEAVIERGLATFVEVGAALLRIRDGRLYRETHATFEDYCRERWGMSRIHAHRLIEASEVAGLLPIGNIANEAQARALAPLKDDPEAARVAVEMAYATTGRATAAAISDAVRQVVAERQLRAAERQAAREWTAQHAPADFDATADAHRIEERGALARLCRDLVAFGDPEAFRQRHEGWLREEHYEHARHAVLWLNGFLGLTALAVTPPGENNT